MDEITIGDKVYVSSKQAAKITGYAKDYVGQLCREGRIEARLVGRNWYVLETALREHRFGKKEEEPAPAEPEKEENPAIERVATWQKPQYEPEVPTLVPDLAPKATQQASSAAIADMQTAWKEWFEEKKPRAEVTSEEQYPVSIETLPEAFSEATEEPQADEEVPVAFSRVAPAYGPVAPAEEAEESEVPFHRSDASRETGERVPVSEIPVVDLTPAARSRKDRKTRKEPREARGTGSGVQKALLAVLSLVAVLIAIIGTGHADRLLAGTSFNSGVQKSVVDFLGGTRTYESSL